MNAETSLIDNILAQPYVLATRKQDQYKVIDVEFPIDWEIPERLFPENCGININQSTMPPQVGYFIYIFFSEKKQFSEIYHVIQEVVRYNKEKEEKLLVFNKLQQELQTYFDTLSLKDFSALTFNRKGMIESPKPPPPPAPPASQLIKEGHNPINLPVNDGTILKP